MASPISITPDEQNRAVKTLVAVMDLLSSNVAVADGKLDAATNTQLLDRSRNSWTQVDASLVLDLADRLGEDNLRKALKEITPPNARSSVDALLEKDGGVLSVLKARIGRLKTGDATRNVTVFRSSDDDVGCLLGAIAVVGGVAANNVLGGIAAVTGIMVMAAYCS